MPAPDPDADPAPPSGELPPDALASVATQPLSLYVHVPFCVRRCGYCDFNTYTLAEAGPATPLAYLEAAHRELDLAAGTLGPTAPRLQTVFFGGGTPTMLSPAQLGELLGHARALFGVAADAEITTEANPDTLTEAALHDLAAAGFTRVSVGMQSAVSHVLAALDRSHVPANVAAAVRGARAAGLGVSLDLIYGAPGESLQDWRDSLTAAIDLAPDHLSAYALTVEPGTRLAARIARGELPGPTDDDEADKYELADELFAEAGYRWYEVSNWARTPADACRHNLAYWRGANWWGIGPGAHSHVGGVRWWNVRHPGGYASRLATGESPAAGREVLDDAQRATEQVMLGIRLAEGLPVSALPRPGAATGTVRTAIAGLIADGLVDGPAALADGRLILTRRGRLLADGVIRRLLAAVAD